MMAATLPTPAPKQKELSPLSMVGLVSEIGFMIALPAALFGFGGAYVDKFWGTSPLMTIVGLALALASSVLAVWHRVKPFLNS